ncbi:MAG: hypothetical protein ACR2PC_15105 [Tsuneonella suprasediminis]
MTFIFPLLKTGYPAQDRAGLLFSVASRLIAGVAAEAWRLAPGEPGRDAGDNARGVPGVQIDLSGR